MSRKNTVQHEIVAGQSLAASFNSAPTLITYLDNLSYQINITTSNSVGTFTLQASNDYVVDAPTNTVMNAATWVDLTLGGGTPSVAAANDQIIISMNQMPFKVIRLKYTSSVAGTGTCDIWINGKQVGA